MIQLNRSMMERYEIPDHRPQTLRAALFGADGRILGAAARLLDIANERGGDLGALCVTAAAPALRAQDGMFTLLVRGDRADGTPFSEERVVQSILEALEPDADFDALMARAALPQLNLLFVSAGCGAVELMLMARFLYARWSAKLDAPEVLLLDEHPLPETSGTVRAALRALGGRWEASGAFDRWLEAMPLQTLLCDGLSGRLSDQERARAQRDMNYRDDFIAWAEPLVVLTPERRAPEALQDALDGRDFADARLRKARIFDALTALCAAMGFLCGLDSFSQVMRDEELRAWIGRAVFDELMPALPMAKEAIAPDVISAFGRLENSMNDMPLLEIGRGLVRNFPRTLLPAIQAWAEREYDAPARLSLALSAIIMLYAGARENRAGGYEVQRGERAYALTDDPEILRAFSLLAHDVPAETLAYAALADRTLWGADLREIDGLELRVSLCLSSIQRIGLRETLRLQEKG